MNRSLNKYRRKTLGSSSSRHHYTPMEISIHFRYAAEVAGGEGWEHTHDRYSEMKSVCQNLGIRFCTFDEFRSCYRKVYSARRGHWMPRAGRVAPYSPGLRPSIDPDIERFFRSVRRSNS